MPTLKGTQTEKNLMIAFAGESQARNRYTMFASAAKKEGFHAIGKIFLETAEHEYEHASRLFKFMEGGMLEITASFPAGRIGTTLENLKASAYGENEENTEMYPRFAQIAAQEGFPAIAEIFKNIILLCHAKVNDNHIIQRLAQISRSQFGTQKGAHFCTPLN